MDYNLVKDNPLLKQHVIYCGRHAILRRPELCANRCVISISDTVPELIEMQELLTPMHWPSQTHRFLDVELGEQGAMANTTAASLVQFIEDYRDCNFLVHCFLGASRSAAVAKFIVEYLGLDDSDTANLNHYNKHVYNLLSSVTKVE